MSVNHLPLDRTKKRRSDNGVALKYMSGVPSSIECSRVVYPQRGCTGKSIQSEDLSWKERNDLRVQELGKLSGGGGKGLSIGWFGLQGKGEEVSPLNDLDNATLHIDGQSTEVDAPPDIIDVVDEDDDIIDDEDALPHDLADSDDEDLINVDDDGVDKMSADVTRSHGGDGGGKGTRKPNLGGRKAGRLHTRQETRNLGLKKITDDKGPVSIRFEWDDKKTMMPLGGHASHWSNYLGELIREMPLYYPSWQKVPAERKAAIVTKIGHGVPPMKRLFKVAMLDPSPKFIGPWGTSEIPDNLGPSKLCARARSEDDNAFPYTNLYGVHPMGVL
ncbi:hypothetical protein Tco_1228218 [Tanacetum coccineum]